jgi:hypothetical protein
MIQPLSHDHSLGSKVDCSILICFLISALVFAYAPPATAQEEIHPFLQRLKEASGLGWDLIGEIKANGEERVAGLHGTATWFQDVRTGRFAVHSDLGIKGFSEVFDGMTQWRQDASGGVHPLNSEDARARTSSDAFLVRRGYLKPEIEASEVRWLGQRTEKNRTYSAIQITPQTGEPIEMWIDDSTHLIDRTIQIFPTSEITTRYADYRLVGSLMLPFQITVSDDDPGDDDVLQIHSYALENSAQDSHFARPIPPEDTRFLDGSGVTVPISFDAGKLVIEAKIDGKGPFPFLLDTGGHAILTPDAARALDLVPTGGGVTHGSGSGSLSEQYTRVKRISIGSAEIKDQSFVVIPLQYTIIERGKEAPLAGILGLEIFERFALSLDYHAKTLTLRPSQGFHYDGPGTKVPTRFSDDIPEIEAVADGAHGVFAIDSGNSGSLVIHAKFGNRSGLAEQLSRGLSLTSFGAGGESQNWINYLDRFEIAGTSLRHVLARYANDNKGAFSSRTEAGNIGSDILARFRIVFDYAGGALYFEADPSFQPTPYSRTGLQALKSDPEAFHVLTILPKTPAAEAGLMPGDVITAVDDISAADMSGSDLFYKMRQPPGTPLKLAVRRGNEVFSRTLVLRELLDRSNDY